MTRSQGDPMKPSDKNPNGCPFIRNYSCFLALLMMLLFSSGDLSAQYNGPAFGSIAGGDSVSTGQMINTSNLTTAGETKVRNPHWETVDPPLYDDR